MIIDIQNKLYSDLNVWCLTFKIYIIQHSLHVSRTCLTSFRLTVRPTLCSCLHKHGLKWKLQPVITEHGKTLFIALIAADSKSSFIIFGGDHKTTQTVQQLTRNLLLMFYPVKVQTESDVCTSLAMAYRKLRTATYTVQRTASHNSKCAV